jgi:hypothetical protein
VRRPSGFGVAAATVTCLSACATPERPRAHDGDASTDGSSLDAPSDVVADAGGDAIDGIPADVMFTPASHPALPQIGTLGGSVLATPKVRAILYEDDAAAADLEAFLQELAQSSYWSATTAEYGVGPLTVLAPIIIHGSAAPVATDDELQAQLVSDTSGVSPIWGSADPDVVYLFVIPAGATVEAGQATCCNDFGGYHLEVASGGTRVPYAVACSCPGTYTMSPLDVRTTAISHELVEAATDPFPLSHPAYAVVDDADAVWAIAYSSESDSTTGAIELGDMCTFNDDRFLVLPGSKDMVQRTWSNAAARALQNPCVPDATTTPYFNSFPALDAIAFGPQGLVTRGVRVPIGQSRTIDVNLFSAGPTKGPWTVSAFDYDAYFLHGGLGLGLALDTNQGANGDTLHLTITPRSANVERGGEVFVLVSLQGRPGEVDYQTNVALGLVTNE